MRAAPHSAVGCTSPQLEQARHAGNTEVEGRKGKLVDGIATAGQYSQTPDHFPLCQAHCGKPPPLRFPQTKIKFSLLWAPQLLWKGLLLPMWGNPCMGSVALTKKLTHVF